MGGNQSTRQIVIDNQNNVVQVTEDVQRRLQGLPDRQRSAGESKFSPDEVLTGDQIEAVKRQLEAEFAQVLMENRSETQKIKTEEFARAVQEVEAKFIKQTGSPVCPDLQQKVYECYHNHLHQPLYCGNEVKAFAEAVDRERRNVYFSRKS